MWKLTFINSVIFGLVIWLVGISVKDFACYLIETKSSMSLEQRDAFIEKMNTYLITATAFSIVVAAVVHFYFINKLISPLHSLTFATKEIAKGNHPKTIEKVTNDEIGQLTDQFNYMVDQLKASEIYRDKMTRDIAHELRTPLTNISGYLEALSTGVLEGDKNLYNSLYEESMRLTNLVEQLQQINYWNHLDRSKNIGGQSISLKDLFKQQLGNFQREFNKQNINVTVEMVDVLTPINEDGMKQVITNLMQNVIKYDRGKWLRIKGYVEKENYFVEVTNEGLPIVLDYPTQPFERFYRAELSRNRNLGGSGLGLAIVKEIIESHRGTVGLNSQGNVHTFWFSIPITVL